MLDDPKTWQIRSPAAMMDSIAEFFIRYGVALLWPGDLGRWSADRYANNYAESDWVRWFAQTMSIGDAILLRTGSTRIRAVGLVAGEYSYEERFDDVYGFDLQHCRRVRWCELPEEYEFVEPVFTRGRFSAVRKASVHDYVRDFLASPPTQWQDAPLPELPAEGVEGALEQAKGYVESLGVPRDVVVTDGIRYRMYSCENGFAPIAYANLIRLKHPAADLFSRLKRP